VTVSDEKLLTASFEESRAHLRAVAYRMLGSKSDAEDAVQETWLRLSRADTAAVDNLRGWLTTVIARVCLDMLRSRKARAEEPDDTTAEIAGAAANAEKDAVLADSVSLALLVVLQTLEPAERLAFVLHDLFDVSFDEIAPIVGRTEVATRQLASRARRRVRGAPERDEAELARQRSTVEAFLVALRAGDVEGVVAVLDPNVVVHAEDDKGKVREIRGARTWATSAVQFSRVARDVYAALVDGTVGAIYAPDGKLARVLKFTFDAGRVVRVDIMITPAGVKDIEIDALPQP